jgi:hypothetical protein
MEGRVCPLGLRMPSTCAWHPPTMQPRPCRAPGSPVCFCRSLYPQIDNERPPSPIEAMGLAAGRMQGGGSVLEVQTVSLPDRDGGHLLLQDIEPVYRGLVLRSPTFRRDNELSKLSTCEVLLAHCGEALQHLWDKRGLIHGSHLLSVWQPRPVPGDTTYCQFCCDGQSPYRARKSPCGCVICCQFCGEDTIQLCGYIVAETLYQ